MRRPAVGLLALALMMVLSGCIPGRQTATTSSPAASAAAVAIASVAASPSAAPSASPSAAPSADASVAASADATDSANASASAESNAEPSAEPSATAGSTEQPGGRLALVKQRGYLICMSNGNAPGFSENKGGAWTGFDVDFCRVIATAIFGEPNVEFRIADADPKKRYSALRDGEIDVIIRNTTWTMNRDASAITGEWAGDKGEGVDFGPIIFNDGQGVMVRKSLNVSTIEELENPTICVLAGTTTEKNLADQFKKRGILYTAKPFEGTSSEAPFAAYDRGDCDVVTADRSQLLTRQPLLTNPNDHVILNTWISKEPLAPVVAQNDSQWRDVVSYAVYATMQAEEFKGFGTDVSSKTIESLLDTTDPDLRRFLGLEGSIGLNLGLDNEFARNIIEQVGNYEEIYARNLGKAPEDGDSDEKVATPDERGPNKVWNYPQYPGGLLNPPPFR